VPVPVPLGAWRPACSAQPQPRPVPALRVRVMTAVRRVQVMAAVWQVRVMATVLRVRAVAAVLPVRVMAAVRPALAPWPARPRPRRLTKPTRAGQVRDPLAGAWLALLDIQAARWLMQAALPVAAQVRLMRVIQRPGCRAPAPDLHRLV
jgi:hypothetical protein